MTKRSESASGLDSAKTVSFSRFSPHTATRVESEEMAEAFGRVFATSPWYEWKKCRVAGCSAHWGVEHRKVLEALRYLHCGEPVVDYWPRDAVLYDLYHEIGAVTSCWVARERKRVIGFSWGYPIPVSELSRKVGIRLEEPIRLLFSSSSQVAYQDELGVLSSYRGTGVARKLFSLRLDDFIKQCLEIGVVRTRALPEPSVTYLWFTEKLGYRELARYPGDDGRVILGQRLDEVKKLLSGK